MRPDQAQAEGIGSAEVRVSTIELFFDLVFVFAITQLTGLLAGDPTVAGLGRIALIFGNLWWIYGGYAWLTNAVPPREPALRLLMMLGMGGFLIVALAIPTAFDGGGVALGVGYLLVTLVHTGMFLLSSHESAVPAMRRLGPANAITAALLLLAGFTDGALQWMLWTAAFGLHWVSPFFTAVPGFPIRAAHFVERHGLIVLIGLGESIVAIGIGIAGHGLQADRVATAVLGLALAAALWWLYFDGEDERAERVLDAAAVDRTSWLALYGFGYAFLPVLGGIVVFAAGVKNAVGHYGEPPTASTAWFLAAGVATYLVGLAWFRRLLGIGPIGARLLIAAVVLPTVMIGLAVSPEAQLGVLAAVVVGGVLAESAWERRRGPKSSPTRACAGSSGAVMSMRYKLLGRTGLRVSELCLGAMIFGDSRGAWGASRNEAARIVERFAEAGGNFVDTANYYAHGESERIVGAVTAVERERWVLSTKYTLTMRPDDPNGGGAHRKSLVQSLEASLRRLGTDYLDLYWVHIWDAFTPVEEVVRALDDVVSAGKVLYVGISDTPAWIVAQAVTLADLRGWTRFAGLQVPYSLVERSVERELLPMAQALELTVTAWSPLGGGLLTGRYGSDRQRPGDTRVAAIAEGSLTDRNLAIADAVNTVAAERGASSAQVAIAWVRAQQARAVIVPMLGARRREQLEDNLGALELELTAAELARLEEVSRIELGFPHDFGADRLAYGATRPLIDSHRVYRPGPLKEKA